MTFPEDPDGSDAAATFSAAVSAEELSVAATPFPTLKFWV